MKLSYSILWFDDTEEFFDSLDIDWLKKEIENWGFLPDIKPVSTPDQFLSFAPYENIDLIVVDRNLEGYGEGQTFIASLRDHAVFTEVIFYTSGNASTLWDAIRERELEGVFVSNKGTILQKVSKVGRQSVRKVLDLENMRGIMMAEVGELDHLLEDILTIGLNGLSDDMLSTVFRKFHKEADKQNREFGESLDKFLKAPNIQDMLSMCDSNKRWENFSRLWKYHDKLKDKGKFGDYKADVLDLRNILAHGKPKIVDGGYLFTHRGKEYLYNSESSGELRKTILKYKREFFKVLEALKT